MSIATQSRRKPRAVAKVMTEDQKHEIATQLTREIHGKLYIKYEPATVETIGDWTDEESRGRHFSCSESDQEADGFDSGWYVDTKGGDPRAAIVASMRERAVNLFHLANILGQKCKGERDKLALYFLESGKISTTVVDADDCLEIGALMEHMESDILPSRPLIAVVIPQAIEDGKGVSE
jgi:hypothetical protein